MHGVRHVPEHGQTLRATSVTQIQKSRRCENTIWMKLHCFMLVHGGDTSRRTGFSDLVSGDKK